MSQFDGTHWPIQLTHDDAPDFRVIGSDDSYAFDVTEATRSEDRRESAVQEPGTAVPFGSLGGRPYFGLEGEDAARHVLGDIRAALHAKSLKRYDNSPTAVCIYCNSNPAVFLEPVLLLHQLHELPVSELQMFRWVFVLLNGSGLYWNSSPWVLRELSDLAVRPPGHGVVSG
jgi:hypothetical protein